MLNNIFLNKMNALVYTAPHTLIFSEVPMPVLEGDELLVKVEAVGICGSDMHAYHGFDNRRPAPLILGHEAAGHIASGSRKGERVTINPLVVDPSCPYAVEGRWHLSPTRQILSMPPREGAFAQFIRVPLRNIVSIPDSLQIYHAALAEPIAVAWHGVKLGVKHLHQPLAAAKVAILGGGAIGLACALVARHFGAKAMILAEPSSLRRQTAQESLDIHAYSPLDETPDDNSVDLVIDCVGAVKTREAACKMVRPGGVIVHVGLLPGLEGLDIRKITLQEITLTGSYCYTPQDFKETVQALINGHLGALNWFETRALSAGQAAFEEMDSGVLKPAKLLLLP